MNFQNVKIALAGIAAGILLLGCAPSSYGQRYGSSQQLNETGASSEASVQLEKKSRSGGKILSRNRNRTSESTSGTRFSSANESSFSKEKLATEHTYNGRYGKSGSAASENMSSNLKDTMNIKLADVLDEGDEYNDGEMPEEKSIDISYLLKNYSSGNTDPSQPDRVNSREKVLMEVIKYLNTPYVYGGNSADGIDCSAFTRTVIGNTFSFGLPRSAREQYQVGEEIDGKDDLEFGDLVFFNTRRRVRPGHVGIYLGDNLFAHASSHNGVIVSSLDSTYYAKRYMGARRLETVAKKTEK